SPASGAAATAPAAVPAPAADPAAAAASRAESCPRPFSSLLAPPSLFRSSVLLRLCLRLRRACSSSFCRIAERRACHWGPGSQLTPPEGPAARGHLFLDRRLPSLQSAIHCVASNDGAVLGGQCPEATVPSHGGDDTSPRQRSHILMIDNGRTGGSRLRTKAVSTSRDRT
ncbi:hypothetical protein GW17_00039395, partial [Ensete ventricosum]